VLLLVDWHSSTTRYVRIRKVAPDRVLHTRLAARTVLLVATLLLLRDYDVSYKELDVQIEYYSVLLQSCSCVVISLLQERLMEQQCMMLLLLYSLYLSQNLA
jgi:hypothetical protein